MDKLLYGVGLNDSEAPTWVYGLVDGKKKLIGICPFFKSWSHMLERSCSEKYKSRKPTYRDVKVCDEWLVFSNFRRWMQAQDWHGKQLDKDILVEGNKLYAPELCVFIDGSLNSFTTDNAAKRGPYPIGAMWKKSHKKFVSQCKNPLTKRNEHLGFFSCPNQAHLAWKRRKHEIAFMLAELQKDPRVAEALRNRYKPDMEQAK
jgi:hypothetical protein